MYIIVILRKNSASKKQISATEYQWGNQKWTIQRNWQHSVHKTKKNKTKYIYNKRTLLVNISRNESRCPFFIATSVLYNVYFQYQSNLKFEIKRWNLNDRMTLYTWVNFYILFIKNR
jgi:hypothetical protein